MLPAVAIVMHRGQKTPPTERVVYEENRIKKIQTFKFSHMWP